MTEKFEIVRGRPKLNDEFRRSEMVRFFLTPSEMQKLKQKARAENVNFFARGIVMDSLLSK